MSDRGPYWQFKRKPSAQPPPPNPTLVEIHEWVQPSHCHQHDNTLRHGHLLRWMDIAACLSAEKHAKVPCVTVSMDDITFDATVSNGHVVILRAVVNRAFTSSMEVGINVKHEDPVSGETKQACSVFVARPKDGSKIALPLVTLATEEEHREHLLAAERRRMRVTYAKDIQKIINNLQIEELNIVSPSTPKTNGKELCVKDTQVNTTKIVLPVHANHHGTTFGGQIMEWVTEVANISALRLCRSQIVLESVESFHFRGPSYMGERVSLNSSVNKVFSNKRFEVGVRVEGYAVGGEKRHINSAFFVFRPSDPDATLPNLVADTKIAEDRAAKAIARHCLSLDRKAIRFHDMTVSLNSENVYDLIVNNITKFTTNYSLRKWELLQSSDNGMKLSKHQTSKTIILRLTDTLEGIKVEDAFRKLTTYKNRSKWDFLCKHVREYWCVTEDDSVLHMVFKPALEGELPKDFVMLASKRKPVEYSSNNKFYTAAFTSVLSPDIPPLKDYERSNVISSGYVFEDVSTEGSDQRCQVTYVHQVGSSVMPFFAKDLLGASTLLNKLYASLKQYLLNPSN